VQSVGIVTGVRACLNDEWEIHLMVLWLLVLAVIPSIALVVLFYVLDRYEPEPRARVLRAFLYGTLLVVPALFVERWARGVAGWEFLLLGGLRADLVSSFLTAGLPEEGVKFLLMMAVVVPWTEFDEPFDGIVYGSALALGFACVENVVYVLRTHMMGGNALHVALLRGILSVPAHALYGASMGALLGKMKFESARWAKWLFALAAVLVPWGFHGTYDLFCLFVGRSWGWTVLIVVSLVMWGFVLWFVPHSLAASPFKPGAVRSVLVPDADGNHEEPHEEPDVG